MKSFIALSNLFTVVVVAALVSLAAVVSSQVAARQVENNINNTIYNVISAANKASQGQSAAAKKLFEQVQSICDNTPGCAPK